MGVVATANPVLKALALVAFVVIGVVTIRACTREAPRQGPITPESSGEGVSPRELGAEGDTETETLRTLIAEVKRLHEDYATLQTDNKTLREQNDRLQRMEDRLTPPRRRSAADDAIKARARSRASRAARSGRGGVARNAAATPQ